jgi:hypothetical protein
MHVAYPDLHYSCSLFHGEIFIGLIPLRVHPSRVDLAPIPSVRVPCDSRIGSASEKKEDSIATVTMSISLRYLSMASHRYVSSSLRLLFRRRPPEIHNPACSHGPDLHFSPIYFPVENVISSIFVLCNPTSKSRLLLFNASYGDSIWIITDAYKVFEVMS